MSTFLEYKSLPSPLFFSDDDKFRLQQFECIVCIVSASLYGFSFSKCVDSMEVENFISQFVPSGEISCWEKIVCTCDLNSSITSFSLSDAFLPHLFQRVFRRIFISPPHTLSWLNFSSFHPLWIIGGNKWKFPSFEWSQWTFLILFVLWQYQSILFLS